MNTFIIVSVSILVSLTYLKSSICVVKEGEKKGKVPEEWEKFCEKYGLFILSQGEEISDIISHTNYGKVSK